jgi:GT2 family glycosyltransferase
VVRERVSCGIVDIIIPSMDNPRYLTRCLSSLLEHPSAEIMDTIHVVNNGRPAACDWITDPLVNVIQSGGKNLGWEGGLQAGLDRSQAPFVCFLNDDTRIPDDGRPWLDRLLWHFDDPAVGAVGPASHVVMGYQNAGARVSAQLLVATFLIGFCLLVRRDALERIGGIDQTLPGGDDLDLSIRLRDAGYLLLIDRGVYVHHAGFKTGNRVHGRSDRPLGWNSPQFIERTDRALIEKHGRDKWLEVQQAIDTPPAPYTGPVSVAAAAS